jgi:septum site-determining protein MinD
MLSKDDVVDLLSIELIGVIPESEAVLKASNSGKPIIYDTESDAGQAYKDTVDRILGKKVDFRFLEVQKKGFFARLFRK